MTNEKSHTEKYKELELEKWRTLVQLPCEARLDTAITPNLCLVTDRKCSHDDCFALRIIKISKGFL